MSTAKHEIVNTTQTVLSSIEMLELELSPAARSEVMARLSNGAEHLQQQVQQLVAHMLMLQAAVETVLGASEHPGKNQV
jgi:hypothetical protein